MIPLEFIARRVATGSFLKRNPGVAEGTRFNPLKIEITLKDDEKGDPLVSEESIVHSSIGNVQIAENNQFEVDAKAVELMKTTTAAVFEVLERVWASVNVMLVVLKVEFGVDLETSEGKGVYFVDVDKFPRFQTKSYSATSSTTTPGDCGLKEIKRRCSTSKFIATPKLWTKEC